MSSIWTARNYSFCNECAAKMDYSLKDNHTGASTMMMKSMRTRIVTICSECCYKVDDNGERMSNESKDETEVELELNDLWMIKFYRRNRKTKDGPGLTALIKAKSELEAMMKFHKGGSLPDGFEVERIEIFKERRFFYVDTSSEA